MSSILMGNILAYGTYFFWYELFKINLSIKPTEVLKNMFGSFLAGVMATAITNPFWLLNAKMAVANVLIK